MRPVELRKRSAAWFYSLHLTVEFFIDTIAVADLAQGCPKEERVVQVRESWSEVLPTPESEPQPQPLCSP